MKQALLDDEQRRGKSGNADYSTVSSASALKAARKFSSKIKKPETRKYFNCGQASHFARDCQAGQRTPSL